MSLSLQVLKASLGYKDLQEDKELMDLQVPLDLREWLFWTAMLKIASKLNSTTNWRMTLSGKSGIVQKQLETYSVHWAYKGLQDATLPTAVLT